VVQFDTTRHAHVVERLMPFDVKELRRVMGLFATGVTVITTRDQQGRPYGLTANAITSLSLVPPLLLICVDRKAETFPHFFDSKIFVLNILGEDQEELSRRFATTGGDKFAGLPCHLGRLGTPVLDGVLGHIECRIVETMEGGDHVIHVGEVEHAELHGGRPLLFFQGKYHRLPRDP
jgi:flavin reductase (DIM6/NTAB) family NADH-FMN oxidoreductase RutF